MRRFFIDRSALEQPVPVISGTDARHIRSVLRLQSGAELRLVDGQGQAYDARIIRMAPGRVEVKILRSFLAEREPGAQIIIAQALLKDKKMDLLVRQLSELGIRTWVPFLSRRSIPRPRPAGRGDRRQRWEMIARAALKQCRRGRLLEITDTFTFEGALDYGRGCDVKIIFWENDPTPLRLSRPESGIGSSRVMALVGPEGGFTEQEIETAREAGFVTAGLGPRILKAETAAFTAGVLLQHLFGDLG